MGLSFFRLATFALAALVAAPLAGCTAGDSGADEEDAIAGLTHAHTGLQNPDAMFVAGDKLVYSQAHFIASGDPELDQEFAHWEGELWSVAVKGGSGKRIAKLVGAAREIVGLGGDMLVVDSGYIGVSKFSPSGDESDFYNDYSMFGDDENAFIGGVAVAKDAVYITRSGSEVLRAGLKGGKPTTFAKTWKSGWAEHAEQVAVAGDAVFWSSAKEGDKGGEFRLYRATSGGGYDLVGTFAGEVRDLASDGTSVFIAVAATNAKAGEVAVVPAKGGTIRTLVADTASPGNLTYDAKLGLLFTESSRGVLRVEPGALGGKAVATPSTVLKIKNASALALSPAYLFIATNNNNGQNEKKGDIWRLDRTAIK